MAFLEQMAFGSLEMSSALARVFDGWSWWEWPLAVAPALLLEGPAVVGCAAALLTRWLRGQGPRSPEAAAFVASMPSVSVLLVGYNEANGVRDAIRSILACGYPRLQLIVVDDGSTDGMAEKVQPFADSGAVTFLRNQAASGRGGKPAALNFGALFATNEFLVCLDMDTVFHPRLLEELLAPFHDPAVGAVGGNLRVGNPEASWLTRLQQVEYLVSIGVGRRAQQALDINLIASGACVTYRRAALTAFLGNSTLSGEDLDNSLKVRKGRWKLVFADRAIAWTEVPTTLRSLVRQRRRWDGDLVTVVLHTHRDLLWRWRERFTWELWRQLLTAWIAPVALAVNLVVLSVFAPTMLLGGLLLTLGFYECLTLVAVVLAWTQGAERTGLPRLLARALLLPCYSLLLLMPLRCWASVLALLRCAPQDPYLPASAWRNMPR